MLRVYIETSVWSYAFAEDAPDHSAITHQFFDRCRQGAFECLVSQVVMDELEAARSPLRERMVGLVHEIAPAMVIVVDEARQLADAFLKHGAVPPSKPEDALHVAAAFSCRADVLVSWNFRHIANVRRAAKFNAVAVLEGHSHSVVIATPGGLMYDDELP